MKRVFTGVEADWLKPSDNVFSSTFFGSAVSETAVKFSDQCFSPPKFHHLCQETF